MQMPSKGSKESRKQLAKALLFNVGLNKFMVSLEISSSFSFLQVNCLLRHYLSRCVFIFHFLIALMSSGLKDRMVCDQLLGRQKVLLLTGSLHL